MNIPDKNLVPLKEKETKRNDINKQIKIEYLSLLFICNLRNSRSRFTFLMEDVVHILCFLAVIVVVVVFVDLLDRKRNNMILMKADIPRWS
jgi:Tfp pilus assembly protein PilN